MAVKGHPMSALKGTDEGRKLMADVRAHRTTSQTKGAGVTTFSTDERKQLAAKGQAMPDGSFPIRDKADLENAIHAFGRAGDKAAAKAWIIKRAKALGATSMLPESWGVADGDGDADDKQSAKPKDEIDAALAYVAKRKSSK